MSQTQALYRLQTIDLELEAQRKRLRAIKNQLSDDATLREAQASVETFQASLHPEEAQVKNLNLEIQTVNTQSKQFSDRLYSGAVTNPKELQDIQEKIAALKRRHADLENKLLEKMIVVEDLQTSLATAEEQLSAIEQQRAEEHGALRTEGREVQTAIKALKTDRENALQHVTPDTLALYDEMFSKKQGRVVSPLDGDACSICGVGQTTTLAQRVRQGQELIICSNCGRILIAL